MRLAASSTTARVAGRWCCRSSSKSGPRFCAADELAVVRRSVVLDRLAVEVVEHLDPADHAEAAPEDLARARVPAHVVRVTRAVDEHRHAVRAGAERVRDPRPRRSGDDVPGAERSRLDAAVPRPELEGRRAVEDDEDLLLRGVTVRDGAAMSGRHLLPAEPGKLGRAVRREVGPRLVTLALELDVVDVDDVRRPRRGLADREGL